jgi:hypothetical protein
VVPLKPEKKQRNKKKKYLKKISSLLKNVAMHM